MTLAELAEQTAINESTLSRLEGGIRKPTLELLLPLAEVYAVPLDELVGAPRTGDPRIHLRPVTRGGMTFVPLSRPGGIQAHKLLIPPRPGTELELKTHEGFEWVYVLAGRRPPQGHRERRMCRPGQHAARGTGNGAPRAAVRA